MSKEKTAYVCTECGYDSAKWLGRCPNCGAWDTFKEVRLGKAPVATRQSAVGSAPSRQVRRLSEIEHGSEQRIDTLDGELNRVLGGGLVKGSLVLLGGEPGIGKSTLLLQTVLRMNSLRVLYVSGEESEQQIKMRADRLLTNNSKLLTPNSSLLTPNSSLLTPDSSLKTPDSLFILCETSLERIYEQAEAISPDLIVIDSIQAISSDQGEAFPGSVTQVRDSAVSLLRYVKETGRSVILVGHITKEGSLAGPKVLEHIVDTVLHFEGDRHYMYRVLRGLKNRFGSTSELGIYEMQSGGLVAVSNPSEMLLNRVNEGLSGVAVAATMEGARPLMIETQALVSSAAYGNAQRSATGFDIRRLNMLLAVLEKRAGFKLAQKDVFLNIAGGIKVSDPAIDLSVIVSVLSSTYDQPVSPGTCMAGEVGLSGELRSVTRIGQRVSEAQRLGFRRIIIPQSNMKGLSPAPAGIEVIAAAKVQDALKEMF
ncbi:MAG: DNA repair protein RadA [Bacteroidaceae bacterium]|nr:DNA repair protein RadA [Bacteroidaceae bacterium]